MERWRGLADKPPGWGRCVATIGAFDGVHRGHQIIIERAVARARAAGLPAVAITFDPHPSEVVRPGSHPPVLTPLGRKAQLVAELGIDVFWVLPFTLEFSRMSPATFAHEVLVDGLHVSTVVVGENFRFGKNQAGNLAVLTELGSEFGYTVDGVAIAGEGDAHFSSTAIRAMIAAGDVEDAAHALSRWHRLFGIVVRGDARGRELGFPTANLEPTPFAAIPADGVYAGWMIRANGDRLPAAVSVGTNPTFDGTSRRVEAYILDFSGDLYGEHMALDFVARIRGQIAFDGIEPLIAQIEKDVVSTAQILGLGDSVR